jgi:hypothetical protein
LIAASTACSRSARVLPGPWAMEGEEPSGELQPL